MSESWMHRMQNCKVGKNTCCIKVLQSLYWLPESYKYHRKTWCLRRQYGHLRIAAHYAAFTLIVLYNPYCPVLTMVSL